MADMFMHTLAAFGLLIMVWVLGLVLIAYVKLWKDGRARSRLKSPNAFECWCPKCHKPNYVTAELLTFAENVPCTDCGTNILRSLEPKSETLDPRLKEKK